MRSVIVLSVSVCISGLVACGSSPETGDGVTSSVSPALELSRAPGNCKAERCAVRAIPGAFVSDSTDGPYRALVLSDTHCPVAGASISAFCFFGEIAEGNRIDGVYAAFGDEIVLLYRVGDTSIVLSRYHYERAGSSLQLSTPDTEEAVEAMSTTESWCQDLADCRDQPLVPAVCPGATFARARCEEAMCRTACETISSPYTVAEPSTGAR